MSITIRAAVEDDAAATAALLNPIVAAGCYTIMTEPVTPESQLAWMRSVGDRSIIHVAVCSASRRVLGIQSIEPLHRAAEALRHVGDISTFIALDERRRGIGRALTEATIAKAKALGYRKIVAMIRADNDAALAFYQRQGFTIVGMLREHVRLHDRFIDEVLTERLL